VRQISRASDPLQTGPNFSRAAQSVLRDGAYPVSKGTIRFTIDKPLPAALIKKLVKARVAENEGKKDR
jgi:uncharacterized protein YdhG (YjbR/CyaY superfamily)